MKERLTYNQKREKKTTSTSNSHHCSKKTQRKKKLTLARRRSSNFDLMCRGLRFEYRAMKSKLQLPQHAMVNFFSLISFLIRITDFAEKDGLLVVYPQGGFPLFIVCRQNGNLECLFLWREENWRIRRKTCGARTIANNKLNPHLTPSPGIEPGPQQWEATPLTKTTSLLPFSTVILSKITCCTCDLPLSMLSDESFLLHNHLCSRIGLMKTKFYLLCVSDLQYQNNVQFPVTQQLEAIQTKNIQQPTAKAKRIHNSALNLVRDSTQIRYFLNSVSCKDLI